MFPGLTTKVSEGYLALSTTVAPITDVIRVNDTTASTTVATIIPPFGGFSGVNFIHNQSGGTIATLTTGNILSAVNIPDGALVVVVYSQILGKYVVGSTT